MSVHPPTVVIENITPLLDGGRYPIKRAIGEDLTVEADVFKDGHDIVSALLKWRKKGESRWHETPDASPSRTETTAGGEFVRSSRIASTSTRSRLGATPSAPGSTIFRQSTWPARRTSKVRSWKAPTSWRRVQVSPRPAAKPSMHSVCGRWLRICAGALRPASTMSRTSLSSKAS